MASAAEQTPQPYPLYSTTFTLHRVSPLYTGLSRSLDNPTLLPYARRFRDRLVGDVLRGVRVGLGAPSDELARVGSLQNVSFKVLVEENDWDGGRTQDEDQDGDTTMALGPGRGIIVEVVYEKAGYKAILLRAEEREGDNIGEGFQYFPLMLSRMPASLRETFTSYLESTFDTRISALHLNPRYLTSSLETYIESCSISGDGEVMELAESSHSLRRILRDIIITLGFDLPSSSSSLKTIEFSIAREEIPRLVQNGKRIKGTGGPFMDALASYVDKHMALDMRHEMVKVVRIASGAFVVGAEGKAKFNEPVGDGDGVQERATRRLVDGLVEAARLKRMENGARFGSTTEPLPL
jgi:hypothetical protein